MKAGRQPIQITRQQVSSEKTESETVFSQVYRELDGYSTTVLKTPRTVSKSSARHGLLMSTTTQYPGQVVLNAIDPQPVNLNDKKDYTYRTSMRATSRNAPNGLTTQLEVVGHFLAESELEISSCSFRVLNYREERNTGRNSVISTFSYSPELMTNLVVVTDARNANTHVHTEIKSVRIDLDFEKIDPPAE